MSLVKKHKMTEKRLAAQRANARHSQGAKTPEGQARVRDTNLRHGFYSKSCEGALRALGEDPAEFQALLEGLSEKATVLSTLQESLGERLARAIQRMRRADRMQEGYALRQAQQEEATRQGRLHMQMMRLKMVSRSWQRLAQAVADPRYVTTEADLDFMRKLHSEGVAKEMGEVALALFYQLREPGRPLPGDPDFYDKEEYEKAQRVVAQVKEIFGIGMSAQRQAPDKPGASAATPGGEGQPGGTECDDNPAPTQPPSPPNPYPDVTEEQWAAREPVRQLLENLLTRQVEIFDAQHHELLRQSLAGPSAYERAAEIAPTLEDAKLMQRMEDSSCRHLLRMSGLLIRLRRHERQLEEAKDPIFSGDVYEK
jgi:hypothetical protein